MAHQFKALVVQKMLDVVAGAGEEIFHAQHFVTAGQQGLAQERADKAGAAGYQDTLFHCQLLPYDERAWSNDESFMPRRWI